MEPVLIVGLGNPGPAYAHTRHNVGFRVLGALSARYRTRLRMADEDFAMASVSRAGQEVILLAPATFMNNSGVAVAQVVERRRLPLERMLVVVDDLWLPLGTLRFRTRGSDGGHNGLASIIYSLQTDAFPRLRCGIGRAVMPSKEQMADFVLSPFEEDEQKIVEDMVVRAAEAAAMFVATGACRPANPPKV